MRVRKHNTTGTGSVATSFVKALREVLKKDPGVTVKISRMKPSGMRVRYLGEVSGRDLLEADVSPEELLKGAHGGGDYSLTFNTSSGVPPQGFDSAYKFYIDGKPKGIYTETTDEGRRQRDDTAMTTLKDIMLKLADSAINKSHDDDILREVLVVALNAALSGADPLDQAERLIRISQTLQPQLEPQDPTIALVGAFAPAIAQLLAMRTGGQVAAAKAPAPQGTQQTALAPGAIQDARQRSIEQSKSPAEAPTSTDDEKRRDREGNERHSAFQKLIVVPFRQHVVAGTPAQQLAGEILYMIQFCEHWMAEDPPTLVKDFLGETDPVKLLRAYDTFCSSIPELKNQKELREQIKAVLTKAIVQIYQASRMPAEEVGKSGEHEDGDKVNKTAAGKGIDERRQEDHPKEETR